MRLVIALIVALACTLPSAAAQSLPQTRIYLPFIEAEAFFDPELDALVEAARGLSYPSESDYSFAPFARRGPAGSPADLCRALGEQAGQPWEQRGLEQFFARLTNPGPDASGEERAIAARYAALRDLAATLDDGTVCRVGLIRIDVYIMGISQQGNIIGLRTVSIET